MPKATSSLPYPKQVISMPWLEPARAFANVLRGRSWEIQRAIRALSKPPTARCGGDGARADATRQPMFRGFRDIDGRQNRNAVPSTRCRLFKSSDDHPDRL